MFHRQYPTDVAGIVLVDAVPDDFSARMDSVPGVDAMVGDWSSGLRQSAWLARLGVARLLHWCGTDSTPREIAAVNNAIDCWPSQMRARLLDGSSFEEDLRSARAAGSFGDLPLVVVSRDPTRVDTDWGALAPILNPIWNSSQLDLLALSSHSSHMIALMSGHDIPFDRPDVIVDAIRKVIAVTNGVSKVQRP